MREGRVVAIGPPEIALSAERQRIIERLGRGIERN